jgi:PAP2 superfamily C-terminal
MISLWVTRTLLVGISLGVWFWTQALIARRGFPEGRIGDRLLDLTAGIHRYLLAHPRAADRVLMVSSLLIDLLGCFLLGEAIFGATFRPFIGLLVIFVLRQLCQGLCALPCPDGMIWRDPGLPSLLVTYGTSADLFFSGHTAIAVYGSIELARYGGTPGAVAGVLITIVEVIAVLILRAHYTMDVFAGAVTALWVATFVTVIAPPVDQLLAGVVR